MKKKTVIAIIGWGISIIALSSILANMDLAAFLTGFKRAEWKWLFFAAVINLAVMAVKAWRWRFIMGKITSYLNILRACFIGHAGNNIFPARGGDWLRIYLLGRQLGVSKAALTSVTGLDKLFDGVTILVLAGLFLLPIFKITAIPYWAINGAKIIFIVTLVAVIVSVLFFSYYKKSPAAHHSHWMPNLVKRLGSGMNIFSNRKTIINTAAVSFVSTFLQIITIWSCQKAFGIEADLWTPAIIFICVNLAITIPSAPSGIGPFEAAAVLTYMWLGLTRETAFNISLMYHAVQFFPVTALGLIFYLFNATIRSKGVLQMKNSTKIIILSLMFLPSFAFAQLNYTPGLTLQNPGWTFKRTLEPSHTQGMEESNLLIPAQIERIDPRTVKRLDIRKDTTEFERLNTVERPNYKPY